MDDLGSSDPDDLVNFSTPTAGVSCVQPHIFVGTFLSEQNYEILFSNKISHICQIGSELQPSHADKFTYISVSCYDNHNEDLTKILRPCLEFMDNAISTGGNVLVHCMAGVSRSPALCCAYLMWKQRLSMNDALARVTAAHPPTQPNAVFLEQLKSFEMDLGSDINKLPATRLEDISNDPEGSEGDIGVGKGGDEDDVDDDSDLGNNLTEEDWL